MHVSDEDLDEILKLYDECGGVPDWDVDNEYELLKGCRCFSCWEPTGKWKLNATKETAIFIYFNEAELCRKMHNVIADLVKELKQYRFFYGKLDS